MYRDTPNVEHEMYCCAGDRWSQWNSNKIVKKHLESLPGKRSINLLNKTTVLEQHTWDGMYCSVQLED